MAIIRDKIAKMITIIKYFTEKKIKYLKKEEVINPNYFFKRQIF